MSARRFLEHFLPLATSVTDDDALLNPNAMRRRDWGRHVALTTAPSRSRLCHLSEGFGNPAREIGQRFLPAGRFAEREGSGRAVDVHQQQDPAAGNLVSYGDREIAVVEPAQAAVPAILLDQVEDHAPGAPVGDSRAADFMRHEAVADRDVQPRTAADGDSAWGSCDNLGVQTLLIE